MIYLFLLLLTLYGVFFLDERNVLPSNHKYKVLYWLDVSLLVLVPGLSYRIGVDTPSYMREFTAMGTFSELSFGDLEDAVLEPLWVVFSSLCKSLIDDFAFMHTLDVLILTGVIVFFSNKYTYKRFWPLLFYLVCYWVHFTFGAIREALAVSCFLYGLYRYTRTEKFFPFFIWGLLACLFHKFAFVIVVASCLALLFNKNKILFTVFTVLFVLLLYEYKDALILLVWHSSSSIEEKVDMYIGEEGFNALGMVFNLVTRALPPMMLLLINKKMKLFDEKFKPLLSLSIVIGVISSFIPLIDRFYNYIFPVIAVCFANLLCDNTFKQKRSLLKSLLYISVFFLLFLNVRSFVGPSALEYRSNIHYNSAMIPYHSIITMKEDPIREGLPRR